MNTRSDPLTQPKTQGPRLLTCPHVPLSARAIFFEMKNGQPGIRYKNLPEAGVLYISKATIVVRCSDCDAGDLVCVGILKDLRAGRV